MTTLLEARAAANEGMQRAPKLSQCDYILAHLRSGKTLMPAEAFEKFGSLALHSRIAELRERGHEITCELVEVPSGKHVGRYRLVYREVA